MTAHSSKRAKLSFSLLLSIGAAMFMAQMAFAQHDLEHQIIGQHHAEFCKTYSSNDVGSAIPTSAQPASHAAISQQLAASEYSSRLCASPTGTQHSRAPPRTFN